MKHRLRMLPEVREALAAGRPVVALESTIITHGMPAPRNLETARGGLRSRGQRKDTSLNQILSTLAPHSSSPATWAKVGSPVSRLSS